MKKSLYILVSLILLATMGCQKKKYPEPVNDDSIFYAKLLVNGEAFEIKTNENGYYMYTSYGIDSSNVFNLIGEFKQAGCTNCTNTLRIQINDSKYSSLVNSIVIDSALKLKSYDFLSGNNDLGYLVNFSGSYNNSFSSVLWNFGDSTTSTDLRPTHLFKPGNHHVSLTITGKDMCQSTIIDTLSLVSLTDLNVSTSATMVSPNGLSFKSHVTGGKPPYTYFWAFGDGDYSTIDNITHQYVVQGNHNVWMMVTDVNGKNAFSSYNAFSGKDSTGCASNFSFSNITQQRAALSKVSLQFTDSNGTVFTSDNSRQPSGSSLEILSVEEFVKNENDQPVKKTKLKFNCTLYNGAKSVSLQGTEVVVGFAYK